MFNKLPDNPDFDPHAQQRPDNIQDLIYKDKKKSPVLESMDEARALVDELGRAGVTNPRFSEDTWSVSTLHCSLDSVLG